MVIRNHDPYSGHAPRPRDLAAEIADALAEIRGENPPVDPPTEIAPRSNQKPSTRKRPARVRKAPPVQL
jgi:hypothetical protein